MGSGAAPGAKPRRPGEERNDRYSPGAISVAGMIKLGETRLSGRFEFLEARRYSEATKNRISGTNQMKEGRAGATLHLPRVIFKGDRGAHAGVLSAQGLQ